MTPPVVLTVAASDSGGAAGVQADLRTFAMLGVHGACAVTAVTAQNGLGVHAVGDVDPTLVLAQLDAVLGDLPVVAAKTGALGTAELVAMVAPRLARVPVLVVDPVMVSSSGHRLCRGAAERAYREHLVPLATVVTPNVVEAGALLGRRVGTLAEAVRAAGELGAMGPSCVVVTGGHLRGDPVDVLWCDGQVELLRHPRVDTVNDHGTGCTFSAALTARMARGDGPAEAAAQASRYVHRGLVGAAGWTVGSGAGPLAWDTA